MKKIALIPVFVLMLVTTLAQAGHSAADVVINAFRNNKVQDMAKYFDNFVPITINNNSAVYSHNQAEVVLHDFLTKNTPKDFTIMDSGSQAGGSKFAIGEFSTANGKYNVYVLMKAKDNSYLVKEIKITKE